jgi:cyclopropane fatty-acyl-phospholipid synthase-like methyltransferase
VFGEVAEEYDAERPSYPDAVFDVIVEQGALRPGDAALEIGAGTGKATTGVVERGLVLHALEPSAGMARVLRAKNVEVEETTFEAWPVRAGAFRLVFAAQAWHWVQGADRFEKVAAALEPGGTVALFWNMGRDHPEPFKTDNDALYDELVPGFNDSIGNRAKPAVLVADFARPEFEPMVERKFTWHTSYTSAEWIRMLGTHSDHRMLPDAVREQLHTGIGRVIDEHGGRLEATYDVMLYLATRR